MGRGCSLSHSLSHSLGYSLGYSPPVARQLFANAGALSLVRFAWAAARARWVWENVKSLETENGGTPPPRSGKRFRGDEKQINIKVITPHLRPQGLKNTSPCLRTRRVLVLCERDALLVRGGILHSFLVWVIHYRLRKALSCLIFSIGLV